SYPDDFAACPACARAAEAVRNAPHSEADLQLADVPSPVVPEGQADVDLGRPPSADHLEPVSGESAVAWASLVDDPDEGPLKIDAPSDVDVLRHVRAQKDAPASTETSAVHLSGSPSGVVSSRPGSLSSPSGDGPPPSGLE